MCTHRPNKQCAHRECLSASASPLPRPRSHSTALHACALLASHTPRVLLASHTRACVAAHACDQRRSSASASRLMRLIAVSMRVARAPALRWHRQHAHKHCNRSASSTARESRSSCANAVHPATRNIATVHRHDDDDRDDLERDEEGDDGDDGRCERVRACHSHAPKRTRKHAAKSVSGT